MEFTEKKGLSEQKFSTREQIIKANITELDRRKKEKEIDSADYELNYLYYLASDDKPVSKSDVMRFAQHPNGQAISVSQEELEILSQTAGHNLKVILSSRSIVEIDPEITGYAPEDRLIIFPEELG